MIVETDTNEDALAQALRDALEQARAAEPENEPNTLTVYEYADAMDLSEYMARKQLNELCDKGKLKRDRIARVNGWGVRQHVLGYRYVGDAT